MQDPQSSEQKGRILIHNEGLGVPSPATVEARAAELARIAGRAGSEYTETDYEQAKRELEDGGDPANDVESALEDAPSLSEVPGTRGHQVPNFLSQDETTIGQALVEEGLEEGLHDEMVEASKKNIQ